jgi:hypothetical protein
MENKLGPIEINCDAPSYAIVRACRRLGLRDPEDAAWYKLSQYVHGRYGHREGSLQALKALLGFPGPPLDHCLCGNPLPLMESCTFTLQSGREETYRIGQCVRCRTVFWEEAGPVFHED